nr:vegetative cell wall protein gp1-like [Aegilops tauschii subsp. strangulata]
MPLSHLQPPHPPRISCRTTAPPPLVAAPFAAPLPAFTSSQPIAATCPLAPRRPHPRLRPYGPAPRPAPRPTPPPSFAPPGSRRRAPRRAPPSSSDPAAVRRRPAAASPRRRPPVPPPPVARATSPFPRQTPHARPSLRLPAPPCAGVRPDPGSPRPDPPLAWTPLRRPRRRRSPPSPPLTRAPPVSLTRGATPNRPDRPVRPNRTSPRRTARAAL